MLVHRATPCYAGTAWQAQRMRPQLSFVADVGAVRAALLCRFADDLSHFGSRAGRLLAPASPAGGAGSLPAEPVAPRRPALSYNTLVEVGHIRVTHAGTAYPPIMQAKRIRSMQACECTAFAQKVRAASQGTNS